MHGAIPPFPNTPSFRGVQFKKESTRTTLPYLYRNCSIHCDNLASNTVSLNKTRGFHLFITEGAERCLDDGNGCSVLIVLPSGNCTHLFHLGSMEHCGRAIVIVLFRSVPMFNMRLVACVFKWTSVTTILRV
jgi:hypothetical protein